MVMPGAQNKGYAGEDSSFMLLFIISSVLALYWFYRDFWTGLSGLLLDEEYGYLSVSLVVAVLLLYLSLRQTGYSLGFSLLRLLSGLLLVDLSILFYVLARMYPGEIVQLEGLSLVLLFLALFLTVFHPVYARDSLPLLSLFLIIPPPPGFFDWLTPWLSRVVGEIVSSLTGAGFAAGTGFGVIQVATPWGLVSFEVARACTGIVTMSSVLAVVPALLYLLAYSPKGAAVKAFAALAAVAVGLSFGFLGNVVRVLLVVEGARILGPEEGLKLFHYSPSIVYAALSAWLAFWIAERVGGTKLSLPRLRAGLGPGSLRGALGVLLIALSLAGVFAVLAESIDYAAGRSIATPSPIRVPSGEDFILNPTRFMGGDMKVLSIERDPWLTSVLNAFVVYRVTVEYNGSTYNGFLEVVDTPGRLHTWELCLQLQGYNITDSYSAIMNGSLVRVVEMEKRGAQYVLVYRLVPVDLVTQGGERVHLWVRASLLSLGGGERVPEMAKALLSLEGSQVGGGSVYSGAVKIASITAYILMLLLLVVSRWRLKA